LHGQGGEFLWRESALLRRPQGPAITFTPLTKAGTAYRLLPDGTGFVKVYGAEVSVKEKFFLRGEAFYKAKSPD
jgi:hypothetical protein